MTPILGVSLYVFKPSIVLQSTAESVDPRHLTNECKFSGCLFQTVYKFIDGLIKTVWEFTFSDSFFQTVHN
jgi:hypothetical protein